MGTKNKETKAEKAFSDQEKPKYSGSLMAAEYPSESLVFHEERKQLELFRSLSIGKVIGVIGSGVTSTYGYCSWDEFVEYIFDFYRTLDESFFDADGKRFHRQIFPINSTGGKSPDLKNQNKLPYCGALEGHLTPAGKDRLLEKYKELFLPKRPVSTDLLSQTIAALTTRDRRYRKGFASLAKFHINKFGKYYPADCGRLVELFIECANIRTSPKKRRSPEPKSEKIKVPRSTIDPLNKLRINFKIRRFATFNYDLEIERLLEDGDYPYDTLTSKAEGSQFTRYQSRLGATGRAVSISPENASDLISLAALPSDDSESVFHVHGSIVRPADMVVTQGAYNALYLSGHPKREEFEDARMLLFGGNSILYVGVGMSEEDLLRPLRYLSAAAPDRPIYALFPAEASIKDSIAYSIKLKTTYGVNGIPYGFSSKEIFDYAKRLKLPFDHPLREIDAEFISLYDEKLNIGKEFEKYKKFIDARHRRPLFRDKKKFPRLHFANEIASIIHDLVETMPAKDFAERPAAIKKLSDFVCGLATSVALCQFIDFTSSATSLWRKSWTVLGNMQEPPSLSSFGIPDFQSRPVADESPAAKIYESIEESAKSYLDAWRNHLTNAANDEKMAKSNDQKEPNDTAKPPQILRFRKGTGRGTFANRISELSRDYSNEMEVHVYSPTYFVTPYPIISAISNDIKSNSEKFKIILVHHSECLLSSDLSTTQNIAVDMLLREAKNKSDRSAIVFLTPNKKSTNTFARLTKLESEEKRFEPEVIMRTRDQLWPTITTHAEKTRIMGRLGDSSPEIIEKRIALFDALLEVLESRVSVIDEKYKKPAFVGNFIEARHAHRQNYMAFRDERVSIALQHSIMKLMFVTNAPMKACVIAKSSEIISIASDFDKGIGVENLVDAELAHMTKSKLIHALTRAERIPAGENRPRESKNEIQGYVLNHDVFNYLAHRLGLTFGWNSHREWDSATLVNALMEEGPVIGSEDYQWSQNLFEELLSSNDNYSIRSAYAIIRSHLKTSQVLRAGLVHARQSDLKQGPSLIERHISRISRLLTASRSINVKQQPGFYAIFEIWSLNEIAALRYMQGNFHDATMLFRELSSHVYKHEKSLNSRGGTGKTYAFQDPALLPRLRLNLAMSSLERGRFDETLRISDMVISRLEELPPNDDNDPPRHHPEHRLLSVLAHGAKAQAYLYMAKVVLAEKSINDASKELTDVDLLGVQGWIHNLKAQIALAIGNIGGAQTSYKAAMAAANSSQRPDLMLSIEISEIEFKMRCAMGNREKILFMLSELSHREARARALGSQKTVVGILLIRARALLYLEQTEGARSAIIEATCLSILNGMRLRRISSLILMAALMGLRGQKDSAIALLASLRTLATQIRYIRAVIDIDKLEHAIVTRGDIRPWAGHLSDSELNEHFR